MPGAEALAVGAAVLALVAAATSLYALLEARRAQRYLAALMRAASLQERLARSLVRARERPRKRYILFRVVSAGRVTEKDLAKAIAEKFRVVMGESGFVASGAHLIYYDPALRAGVLRVRSDYKYPALAVLGMIRRVGGERIRIIPLGSTGTLKSALKRLRRST